MTQSGVKVREQAALLGPRKSLVSISAQVAEPAAADSVAGRTAVVILNAGIIHRVGPNRMFVALARQLATAGHLVVRFDLSGIGDSEPRTDSLLPLEAALADIREALDSLQAGRQVSRVVLVGLCSGADQALVYSSNDPRVVGVVLIDPSIPRTFRYYLNHYASRAFRLRSWLNFTTGRHEVWQRAKRIFGRKGEESLEDPNPDEQASQLRSFLESAYARAVAARVEILAMFTGDRLSQHNYREQLLDAFPRIPFGARLQLDYFADADHTFTAGADRQALFRVIGRWFTRWQTGGALAGQAVSSNPSVP